MIKFTRPVKAIIKTLANLKFAIGSLFLLGFVIAIGTIVEQDQPLIFYQENYPENNSLFGFLNWHFIVDLQLNKIYTAWWFLSLVVLFASSLLSCTFTTQLPSIKAFKIWKFYSKEKFLKNLPVSTNFHPGKFNSMLYYCNAKNYNVFRQNKKGYAYVGLLGRVAPILVHFSIILLLFGSLFSAFNGFTAQQFIPRGEVGHIQNLTKLGAISNLPQDLNFRINDFWITYNSNLETDQFYSDISIINDYGKELNRKKIFVNEPLVFNGITFYQTDWDIIGLKVRLKDGKDFQLPLKKLNKGGRNFWFCTLPTQPDSQSGISLLLNDLTGRVSVFSPNGTLLKVVSLGQNFEITNGVELSLLSFLTITGVQIKADPGIAIVYLSFLILMVSIYVSFFTYSQIWLLQTPDKIETGGTSNRAVLFFQQEFRQLTEQVNP